MSQNIVVVDRATGQKIKEKVYGRAFVEALYGRSSKICAWLLPLLAGFHFFSKLYGALQKSPLSKKKIEPFIRRFHMNSEEFLMPVESFSSFNDFFIRKLKKEARPITPGEKCAILPADGRYLVYPNIQEADGFVVKGKKFSLEDLLQDRQLAKKYQDGTMVLARLCPTDYHRFHFPCDCIPGSSILITGSLHSVNPIALRKRIAILSHNKREITFLETKHFGTVLFIEVGALCVGSIHTTYTPHKSYHKGDEKGYFSFGGSSLILLFEKGRILLEEDLVKASAHKLEVLGLMGQALGVALQDLSK